MVKIGDIVRIKDHPPENFEGKITKIENDMVFVNWHNHSGSPAPKVWYTTIHKIAPGLYFYPVKRKPTIIIQED